MGRTDLTAKILDVCRRLNAKNMLASADGNVSARLADGSILITPTGMNKAWIREEDLAVVTLDNRIVEGKPSGERLMHLEIYRRCAEARAVVHAHPPTAIAWTIARPELKELPCEAMSELILAVGRVPIVPYARPGTPEMGTNLAAYLLKHRVMILARHGGLSWGEDLDEAYNGMERLEHSAVILKNAAELGGITPLPAEEVRYLFSMREKFGNRTL